MTRAFVGVDPGGRSSGVVARVGDRLLLATVVTRDDGQPMPLYIADVLAAVRDACFAADPLEIRDDAVAVEGLNPPSPHMGVTSVTGLLDTAQVLGAVLATWPLAVVVPPDKHGAAPLAAYPAGLIGERERTGTGRMRHARSAWDIAGAAARLTRLAALTGAAARLTGKETDRG